MKRDLLSFASWSQRDLDNVFSLTRELMSGGHAAPLAGTASALVFEQESLRTRVSFEVGIARLGGHSIFLQQEAIGMATRESVHDIASTLSEYCQLIIARTTRHQTCVQLAESARVPVINAMTDLVHPCQILADAFTLMEAQRFDPSIKLVYIGDGNNIANSWLELATKFPMHLVCCCPTGYEPHLGMIEEAQEAKVSVVEIISDPREAVRDAGVVYTDVWPHAAPGVDEGRRVTVFKPYQVNKSLLKLAKPDCLVMHRLPANRGEEITSDILDSPHSIALKQAHNRVHVQNGIMSWLMRSMV
jgi:ornithine carbamoyltransferase